MDNSDENKVKYRRVSGVMKKSLVVVFLVILVLCALLFVRLIYISNTKGEDYSKAVLSQQQNGSTVIAGTRGTISDRNGVILARTSTLYNVIIEPHTILSRDYYYEPTLKAMESILGYDRDTMVKLIENNSSSYYVKYEKDIDYAKVSEFNAYKNSSKFVVGVWFEEEQKRVYPYDDLASHVIGFTGSDGTGSYGIEQYYNNELSGTDGVKYTYFDNDLIRQTIVREATDGSDLVLTIDRNIQRIVQDAVHDFIRDVGVNNIGVIAMDPNNGEILAMASNEEYNLNDPRSLSGHYDDEILSEMTDEEKRDSLYKLWRNFCVSDTYEPGSTYKTITMASALEEDAVSYNDLFTCEGSMEVGGWTIGCNNKNGHGTITLTQALMKSCNCALMEIAASLGSDKFFEYQSRFGFGKKTGIDIMGESQGIVIPRKNLNVTELATSSFGTTFNVTMIQMASAYASIINGGTYYTPHLVKEVKKENGYVMDLSGNAAVRQTVSAETARFMKDALFLTVDSGTATPAKVDGYLIAGKTGTAQKRPREEKKYVISFSGFAPADDPKLLIYIVLDEIHDESIAGSSSSASRMASSLFKKILPYLGKYPEGGIEYDVDLSYVKGPYDDNTNDDQNEMNPDVIPEGLDEQIE